MPILEDLMMNLKWKIKVMEDPRINDAIKEFVLSKTTKEKIKLLENAFDDGFGVFMGIANILLEVTLW